MFIGLLSACTLVIFSRSLHSNCKEPIKFVTLNNQPCKARPAIVTINWWNSFLYISVSFNKCGGSWNTIDDPFYPTMFKIK